MEGSRHERAAILIAAYVIGFTTAYIGFGVVQVNTGDISVPASSAMASVAAAPAVQPVRAISSVMVTPEGLTAMINGTSVVISATLANPVTGILPDGYNVGITDYSLSPDGQYLYYCEQPSLAVDSCRPFVYSAADAGIHPVTQNGSRVAFALNAPTAVWTGQNTLSANGVISLNKPWQF